jgi:hypothetical protein
MFVFIKMKDELINLSSISRIKLGSKSIEIWLSNSIDVNIYNYSSDIDAHEAYEKIVNDMQEMKLLA